MAFEAVIFDFGGVFTTSPVVNFASFERKHGLPDRFIGGVIKRRLADGAFSRFERAEISKEEFDRAFAEETRADGFEIRGDTLLSLMALELNTNMVDALIRVKSAGLKTGCITNNMPQLDGAAMIADSERQKEALAIFEHFDHVIESSKAGVRKPERRIYEMMCEALEVPPQSCVFIDDLGVNLKPAAAMGMHTVKAPFGDVSPAIEELFAVLGLR